MFVDGHAQSIHPLARRNMGIHIVHDLAHPRKQPAIIQHRLAHGNAILAQLSGVADQPGGLGQSPHRNWAVVGCMPPNASRVYFREYQLSAANASRRGAFISAAFLVPAAPRAAASNQAALWRLVARFSQSDG